MNEKTGSLEIEICGYVITSDGHLWVFRDPNKMRDVIRDATSWRRCEWCDKMFLQGAEKTDRVESLELRVAALERQARFASPWTSLPLNAERPMDAATIKAMQ